MSVVFQMFQESAELKKKLIPNSLIIWITQNLQPTLQSFLNLMWSIKGSAWHFAFLRRLCPIASGRPKAKGLKFLRAESMALHETEEQRIPQRKKSALLLDSLLAHVVPRAGRKQKYRPILSKSQSSSNVWNFLEHISKNRQDMCSSFGDIWSPWKEVIGLCFYSQDVLSNTWWCERVPFWLIKYKI